MVKGKFVKKKKTVETQSNNESAEKFNQDWIDEDIEVALESVMGTFNDNHYGTAVPNSTTEEKILWLEDTDKKFKRAYTDESRWTTNRKRKKKWKGHNFNKLLFI
ncbi:unnamed protein product [Cunninghamella echinulata]